MSLEQPDTNQLAQVEAAQADAMLNSIETSALADAALVSTETTAIEEEIRQVAGLEADAARMSAAPASSGSIIEDISSSVSSKPAPNQGTAEGRVLGEVAFEASGVHAAAKIVKTGLDIIQDKGTGIGRQGAAAKSLGTHSYRTIDDYAKEMRGNGISGKRASFKAVGDEGAGLVERANISGIFTKNSSMRGAAVAPDAINVQLVKTAVLAKTQNLEQNAALVNAQKQTLGNVQQARSTLGLGNNSPKLTQDLASGPKFKAPREEGSSDTSSSWA